MVVEASRGLAERVLHEASEEVTGHVRHTLSQPPSESELTALAEFHERGRRQREEGSLDAEAVYGSVGGRRHVRSVF